MLGTPSPEQPTFRIVSFNIWCGTELGPLLAYLRALAPTTDVFCFQEVLDAPVLLPLACRFRTTLYADLTAALPAFDGAFVPMVSWPETGSGGERVVVPYGLATFVRHGLQVVQRTSTPVAAHEDTLDAAPGLHDVVRPLQITRLSLPGGPLLVATYHAIARPGTKLDSDARIAQSQTIRQILAGYGEPTVLIGDFNLLPETESIRLLERDFRNLIADYAIPTTRSRLNPHYGLPTEQHHADYAFVSPGLAVADFRVPRIDVSDHLPLILDLAR